MATAETFAHAMEVGQGIGIRSITQTVKYSDFVDGGSTAGTMTLKTKLPAYSMPIGSKVWVKTGFTGNSSAVLTIGTSTTTLVAGTVDADILTTDGSVSVYTANKIYQRFATFTDTDVPQDDGQTVAGNYILLTVTSGSDFTSVTAGEMDVTVYFFTTVIQ